MLKVFITRVIFLSKHLIHQTIYQRMFQMISIALCQIMIVILMIIQIYQLLKTNLFLSPEGSFPVCGLTVNEEGGA